MRENCAPAIRKVISFIGVGNGRGKPLQSQRSGHRTGSSVLTGEPKAELSDGVRDSRLLEKGAVDGDTAPGLARASSPKDFHMRPDIIRGELL
jgi:hypothetical protein